MTQEDVRDCIAELENSLDILSTEIERLADQEHSYENGLRNVRQRLREHRAQHQSKHSRLKRMLHLELERESRDPDSIIQAIRDNEIKKEAERG